MEHVKCLRGASHKTVMLVQMIECNADVSQRKKICKIKNVIDEEIKKYADEMDKSNVFHPFERIIHPWNRNLTSM